MKVIIQVRNLIFNISKLILDWQLFYEEVWVSWACVTSVISGEVAGYVTLSLTSPHTYADLTSEHARSVHWSPLYKHSATKGHIILSFVFKYNVRRDFSKYLIKWLSVGKTGKGRNGSTVSTSEGECQYLRLSKLDTISSFQLGKIFQMYWNETLESNMD